jgi:hypothetical protein
MGASVGGGGKGGRSGGGLSAPEPTTWAEAKAQLSAKSIAIRDELDAAERAYNATYYSSKFANGADERAIMQPLQQRINIAKEKKAAHIKEYDAVKKKFLSKPAKKSTGYDTMTHEWIGPGRY